MTEAEEFLVTADEKFRQGSFKDAHIDYGRALSRGTLREGYCRRMRGMCSRRVAELRLQKARDNPDKLDAFLIQSARWLAKAEANLESALEEANPEQQRVLREEQAVTEDLMAEFMRLSGGNPARRLSEAARYRREAELLGA
ncbi:MAG: hypothetical protein ACR2MO_09870 [Acidimicrobiales bacterium]